MKLKNIIEYNQLPWLFIFISRSIGFFAQLTLFLFLRMQQVSFLFPLSALNVILPSAVPHSAVYGLSGTSAFESQRHPHYFFSFICF